MTEFEQLAIKMDHLEKSMARLDTAILEIRVALLGGLDGRPGLLAAIAAARNDVNSCRNDIKFVENKIEQLQEKLEKVQLEGWVTKGKLVGLGGILGAAIGKFLDFLNIKP